MTKRTSLLALAIGCALALGTVHAADQVGSELAWASERAADADLFRMQGVSKAEVARLSLGKLDAAQVSALKRSNTERERSPLKIGLHRDPGAAGQALALKWEALDDGGVAARLAVSSAEAAGLRLGLKLQGLPAGAMLRFGNEGEQGGQAPAMTGMEWMRLAAVNDTVWTPLTAGDTQWVEISLPTAEAARWVSLEVAQVSHLLVYPGPGFDPSKINESEQPCMIDAKCEANPSSAFLSAKNAVASMVFEADGGSAVCSGTLLNDSDSSTQVPYFFSAAHCFTSQTVANTLTTLWFYEATACGSRVEDSTTQQVTGGAQVLYGDAASDVLFLRLNNPAPAGSTFLGWNAAAVNVQDEVLIIHHPAGDAKKYSRGVVSGLGPSSLASGQFAQVAYSTAPTEGGSSGSGLLTLNGSNYQLRGGLLGGASDCSNVGMDIPDNSDDYSRFDLVFPNLQSFLQGSSTPPPSGSFGDFTGAWSNAAQNGWGIVIIGGAGDTYGMYIYHYDQDSTPAWYLSAGAVSNNTYNQPLIGFTGPWFGTNPFNPAQVSPEAVGNLQVTFTSLTTLNVNFTINGSTVQTSLTKLSF